METRCNQPLVIISVDTFYQEKYSAPVEGKYVHAYRITIENKSEFPIRLLKRSWKIMEGNGLVKKVKGEGVLGQQPIIKPSGTFQYISWASLQNNFGKMEGVYYMVNTITEEQFSVKIPLFLLIAPDLLN